MSGGSVRKTCPFLYEKRSSVYFSLEKIYLFLIIYFGLSRLPSRDICCVVQSLCWVEIAHCTLSDGVSRGSCISSLGIIGKSCRYFSLLISRIKPLPYADLSQQSCLPAGRTERSFPEE